MTTKRLSWVMGLAATAGLAGNAMAGSASPQLIAFVADAAAQSVSTEAVAATIGEGTTLLPPALPPAPPITPTTIGPTTPGGGGAPLLPPVRPPFRPPIRSPFTP